MFLLKKTLGSFLSSGCFAQKIPWVGHFADEASFLASLFFDENTPSYQEQAKVPGVFLLKKPGVALLTYRQLARSTPVSFAPPAGTLCFASQSRLFRIH